MKRIRQIIVALLGLFYVGLLYPLYTDLWQRNARNSQNDRVGYERTTVRL